jgi:AAA family ATP:ADP antiporter
MSLKKILPLELRDLPKFLLTSLIYALTLYVYSILRGTKDALIISELGAELISTLKLYGVLPCAVIMTLAYTKLADYFSRVTTYHILIWFFVSFFVIFDLFLYTNAKHIHVDFSNLAEQMPILKYQLVMIGHWSFSMFYIMSELWGSVMLSLMFWQLANQINTIEEAKKFYPLFGFLAQIGLIASGLLMNVFTSDTFAADWKSSIHYICISVLFSGVFLSVALFILGEYIIGHSVINGATVKKKKVKMGLMNSLKHILSSKYIGLITLLILCYGISINLVEGIWKKQVGALYPDPSDLGSFFAHVQIYTGFATFAAMLLGSYMLRVFKWKTAAMFTPTIIILTGMPFFAFIIFQDLIASTFEISAAMILFLAVIFGAAQNVLSKAIKYSFFDPTKEMVYIPLDEDLKAKGKAAADVLGGRLGKSGGAFIQWFMLSFIVGSTLTSLATPMFAIFAIIMIVWFYAVVTLNKEYKKVTGSR